MEPDAHGLTVLPFLMGERSPGWRGDARGAIVGLSGHTQPLEIVRAGLEAVAYRFALIYRGLCQRLPANAARRVIATGGALLRSPTWMQILSDVLDQPVIASRGPQAPDARAALMALEALGAIPSIRRWSFLSASATCQPEHHARYQEALARQQELYRRLLG